MQSEVAHGCQETYAVSSAKRRFYITLTMSTGKELDSSALEDLKREVGGKLYTLTRDDLIEVCDFLTIAGSTFEYVSGKKRSSLISHVTMHLEREELSQLEDQGMAELLVLKDKIVELQQAAL